MQLKQIVVAKLSAFLNSGPKPPRSKILAASAIRRGGPGEDDGERDGEVKPRGRLREGAPRRRDRQRRGGPSARERDAGRARAGIIVYSVGITMARAPGSGYIS